MNYSDFSVFKTLTSVEKVFYKAAFNFEMEYVSGNTEAANEAGIAEVARINKLKKTATKQQTWVNVSTGKTFKAVI
jgi:hypothetical protein